MMNTDSQDNTPGTSMQAHMANPQYLDELPSRPFGGYDWSEHVNVHDLIDALFRSTHRGTRTLIQMGTSDTRTGSGST